MLPLLVESAMKTYLMSLADASSYAHVWGVVLGTVPDHQSVSKSASRASAPTVDPKSEDVVTVPPEASLAPH